MQIRILDGHRNVLGTSHQSGNGIALVHMLPYRSGDFISITTEENGLYLLQLDEALGRHPVYLKGEARYSIPVDELEKVCFPPMAFSGNRHLLTLERAQASVSSYRRNLACNPYDNHLTRGIFPHATANVETRNEMAFAARNAIDGILENHGHGVYPYGSWGINRIPHAELTIEFGRMVVIDAVALTLRADFPHDSYWTKASIAFDDGTEETFGLEKTADPQRFPLKERTITSLKFHKLIKADDSSPFPALTQLEVFGRDYRM